MKSRTSLWWTWLVPIFVMYAQPAYTQDLKSRIAQCDVIYEGHANEEKKIRECKEKVLFGFKDMERRDNERTWIDAKLKSCEERHGEEWILTKMEDCQREWKRLCDQREQDLRTLSAKYPTGTVSRIHEMNKEYKYKGRSSGVYSHVVGKLLVE